MGGRSHLAIGACFIFVEIYSPFHSQKGNHSIILLSLNQQHAFNQQRCMEKETETLLVFSFKALFVHHAADAIDIAYKKKHTRAVAQVSFFSGKSLKGVANHVNERAHVPCSHSTNVFNALLIWCATMYFTIGSTQLQKRVHLTLATFYNFTYVNNIFQVHHDFITCYIPPMQCNWIRKCFALLVLKLTSDTHTHEKTILLKLMGFSHCRNPFISRDFFSRLDFLFNIYLTICSHIRWA